jgi:glycosyltransferase involved in cell wall biosynthesis
LVASELAAPGLAAGRAILDDDYAAHGPYNLVVANDARALPLAHHAAHGAPVWADMHEWAAEEFSNITSWRLLVAPLMEHLCQRYLPRSSAVTTVCDSLAEKYTTRYGVPCRVVRNAGPWVDLHPRPVDDGVVRIVHSGGADPGRNIDLLVDAMERLPHTTLDLFLVPTGNGRYLRGLRERARSNDRLTVHDPVPPAELPYRLNEYDVGAFCMPPINVNAEFALPNKFFDFVQARLAVAVGPAQEMARLVRQYGLGVVSTDFGLDSFVEALSALDPKTLAAAKQASHDAARELSSEHDLTVTAALVDELLSAGRVDR